MNNKNRLIEMFQSVNKMNLTESINDLEGQILTTSFDKLILNSLDIDEVNTQTKNNETFISVNAKNNDGALILFKINIKYELTNDDDVFNITLGSIIEFKYDFNDIHVNLEGNELKDFNVKNQDKIIKFSNKYLDVKSKIDNGSELNENYDEIMSISDIDELIKKKERLGDQINGGLGDNDSPTKYSRDVILKGLGVEMEHTDDPLIAIEIVLDHLNENPKYYDYLEQMELNMNDNTYQEYYPLNVTNEMDEAIDITVNDIETPPYKGIKDKLENKYLLDPKLKLRHDLPNRIFNVFRINLRWVRNAIGHYSDNRIADMLFNYDMKLLGQ